MLPQCFEKANGLRGFQLPVVATHAVCDAVTRFDNLQGYARMPA